jgi:hypothetical protein
MAADGSGQATALFGFFLGVAIAAGSGSAWAVGPRRRWAPVFPTASALVIMWLTGHRLGLRLGPTVPLLGFQVALLGDLVTALVAAMAGAVVQCWLHRWWVGGGRR